ncbi:MAG: biotin/lipoyl-binding protein [Firmicutes bacterium]|jgi:biotin carboxyl carrier protein|nr:biotin/lipoyl-binding protein [Bacillota bacterium]MBR3395848.1 biotin/lipoyl-binding protein [Bacillota bacterium]
MKYKVNLGKKVYEVEVEEGKAMLLDEYEAKAPVPPAAPIVTAASQTPETVHSAIPLPMTPGTQVKSPLPGTVLKVNVAVGDAVKAGDVLMIVEAMKMENEIAAPSDGTVKQIAKEKGASVATGDVLLVI